MFVSIDPRRDNAGPQAVGQQPEATPGKVYAATYWQACLSDVEERRSPYIHVGGVKYKVLNFRQHK